MFCNTFICFVKPSCTDGCGIQNARTQCEMQPITRTLNALEHLGSENENNSLQILTSLMMMSWHSCGKASSKNVKGRAAPFPSTKSRTADTPAWLTFGRRCRRSYERLNFGPPLCLFLRLKAAGCSSFGSPPKNQPSGSFGVGGGGGSSFCWTRANARRGGGGGEERRGGVHQAST